MSWWRDILRQCVFMSLFIIPIPIGAYTIHNGSSAAVALISYLFLSLGIPWAYLKRPEATFGCPEKRVRVKWFVMMWLLCRIVLGVVWTVWKASLFWTWPTIARDIVFIIFMYWEVSISIIGAYVLTHWSDSARISREDPHE